MAGSSLFALLDDIATVLDDVAVMTKVAAQKTAGVLGDDLALNAQQLIGLRAERELPVVWAVAKGSFRNKLILVPAAILISALLPWLIVPLLMCGGAYLCYEGVEKLAHKLLHSAAEEQAEHDATVKALVDADVDLVAFEKDKIRGAIRTDFVLSAEIIVIALGTVKDATLVTQIAAVAGVAVLMTVGVYGFVAAIVKLDDAGLFLLKTPGTTTWPATKRAIGNVLLRAAPRLMKALSVVGTAAMFLVGGGILLHGIPFMHGPIEHIETALHAIPAIGSTLAFLVPLVLDAVAGIVAGALVLGCVSAAQALIKKPAT